MIANPYLPDRNNVQGFILRGYTHPYSCHLLFTFSGGTTLNTKAFFKALYSKVQSAADWGNNKPVSMLNIGLTYNGIALLNVVTASDLTDFFPPTFQNGPASTGSQDSLDDIGDSSPSKWWNGQGNTVNNNLHCIVHVYGLTSSDLDKLVSLVTASAIKNGITEIFPLAKKDNGGRLYQSIIQNDTDKIHFGYTDGISEPSLKNPDPSGKSSAETFNNFLIGYPEGSLSNPEPTGTDTASIFAKDGCYNAFRVIYQDVAAFNLFLKQCAQDPATKAKLSHLNLTEQETEEWFAAKLCGRWRNGSPLMLSPDKPEDSTSHAEDFGYKTTSGDEVSSSLKCPFSAHTRVANPRDQSFTGSEGPNAVSPRILRRGVPYGAELKQDSTVDDGVNRGLVGLFFCGDIVDQFEKLYGWMNYNSFSKVYNVNNPPQDAILGNRDINSTVFAGVSSSFTIPVTGTDTAESIVVALPTEAKKTFLRTEGTAYCLLPSLSSLAQLAGLK